MIKRYIKNPVLVQAVQWNGFNYDEINKFVGEAALWTGNTLTITTLEGNMLAEIGSYVIKGVDGEFYPCREDIFNRTYEEVE